VNYTSELTLGMPHTNRRGFSEPHLLKQAGHCHWQAIAAALGQPLSDLRTVAGAEIYAAFYYIETTVADAMPLESYQVGDAVRFTIGLRAFKNLSLEGRVRVSRADSAIGDADPEIRFANIFITPVTGNSDLKVAAPAAVDWSAIPPLPNAENPFHLTRAAKEEGTLGLIDDTWREVGEPAAYRYEIDRDRDTNGAGLVYFANYVSFADAAERVLNRSRRLPPNESSVRHRRIAYYGNAEIDDRLSIRTMTFVNRAWPRRVGYRHVVSRDSDGALICLTEVIKAAEHAVEF
jgi:probable biosynthetic protein (TIGR04098 family)